METGAGVSVGSNTAPVAGASHAVANTAVKSMEDKTSDLLDI
jgi:hypothetical protein